MNLIGNKKVSEVDEHYLVSLILQTLKKYQSQDLIVQPGDDAAVLAQLLQPTFTADLLVEDIHFRTNWSTAADIGSRAAAANLADLVAMGAKPVALTVSLGLPPETQVEFVIDLITAIATEAAKVSAQVVGGDVTRSEKLVISISAIGDCEQRKPILRAGAKPGDAVGLIGRVGHAQAGLQLLQLARKLPTELIQAHQRPVVQYQAAIAAWPSVSSMIDVSDGLLVDLGHIAAAAGVGINLDKNLIAALITPALAEVAAEISADAINWVLAGGDDHAFALTAKELPQSAIRIGEVTAGAGVSLNGEPIELLGYRHFSE